VLNAIVVDVSVFVVFKRRIIIISPQTRVDPESETDDERAREQWGRKKEVDLKNGVYT
jgi:hypothetical protein